MTNLLIMQLRIELAETTKEFDENEIKIKRLYWELQNIGNPYYKRIEDIKAKEIEQIGDEMCKIKAKLLSLQEKIKSLKAELGE